MHILHYFIWFTIAVLVVLSVLVWAAIFEKITMFRRLKKGNQDITENRLEKNLTFLATVGSVAPYIGLFGTVLAIMQTMFSLSTSANNVMAIVPNLAAALITTALGLLTAIPAIIAYNHLLRWKEDLWLKIQQKTQ